MITNPSFVTVNNVAYSGEAADSNPPTTGVVNNLATTNPVIAAISTDPFIGANGLSDSSPEIIKDLGTLQVLVQPQLSDLSSAYPGCDVVLQSTVNFTDEINVAVEVGRVCQGNSLFVYEETNPQIPISGLGYTYSWYLVGESEPIAVINNNPYFSPYQTGDYTVVVSYGVDCSSTNAGQGSFGVNEIINCRDCPE